ncbi:hypothetical protein [Inquilinus sp. CA228]|uniref:hypothetical protein n=1 Tax=Inquilinus sp. CA228 TaxID=3455609 RepID=UPI003F8D1C19
MSRLASSRITAAPVKDAPLPVKGFAAVDPRRFARSTDQAAVVLMEGEKSFLATVS